MNVYRHPGRKPTPEPPKPAKVEYDEEAEMKRMLRRIGAVNSGLVTVSKSVGAVVLVLLGILLFAWIVNYEYELRENCRRKGGTYLGEEGKCLKVQEIR